MTSPKINYIGGILRKITVRTLGAETLDVGFIEIGFTGHTCNAATVGFYSEAREGT
jgi:hypothetical protein